MSESDDRLRHYVLLSVEAELLSERSVSPYVRDAYLRLSKFWLARATELESNPSAAEEFHAPGRMRI
jgi:hypothetical protein